jgi:adenylate cyclase
MTKLVPSFLRRVPFVTLLCFGATWLLMQTGAGTEFEWRTLDWRTQWRVHFQDPPDARIAVVLFDDSTEALIPWPPDRKVHGDLMDLTGYSAPSVVVWDVILDAVREGTGDVAMAASVRAARARGTRTVTASASTVDEVKIPAGTEGPTRPLKNVEGDIRLLIGDRCALVPFLQLREVSWHGLADTPPGPDGIRREIPLVVRVGETVFPSLALQTLMVYLDVPADAITVRLGEAIHLKGKDREWRVPIAANGTYLLNYRFDRDVFGNYDFTFYSYLGVLTALNDRFVDKNPFAPAAPRLKDKIVFIAQIVSGKADLGPSPLSGLTPLVLLHANLVNNVLAQDYVWRPQEWLIWLVGAGVGCAGALIGRRRPVSVFVVFVVLSGTGYLVAAFAVWVKWSLWLPLAGPLLAFVASQCAVGVRRVLQEQRGRERVNQMFGTYLSPELLKKMLKDKQGASVRSERRAVTILFSDLRDFTSLSERLGQDELIALLNEYLAAMVECIHEEGGTLHKFIGDAVMAVWGDLASAGAEEDAGRAARAALKMHRRLAELNAGWQATGRPELRMGVGLNHGTVLVGNIGSPRRMEFTVIGDAVNLASRLESLTKELKAGTLAGESLEPLLAGRGFRLVSRGTVPVKGKAQPVAVFELLAPVAGSGEDLAS